MSIALLDVNFLVALLDPNHTHHEEAHRWFGSNRTKGWATSPLTINGCIRVLSNPAYPTVKTGPREVGDRLRVFCESGHHHFWSDSVSILDTSLFRLPDAGGHLKLTDIYLLGLALKNHGRLATFDRSVSLESVHGAGARNLVILGSGD